MSRPREWWAEVRGSAQGPAVVSATAGPATREVVVGTREELLQDEVAVGGPNWHGAQPVVGDRLLAQLRHRSPPVGAVVEEVGDVVVLSLDEPRAAITPGQSAVLFDGDRLVGGGRIVRSRTTAKV